MKKIVMFLLLSFTIHSKDVLTFGYASGENPIIIYEKFFPLITHISEELGVEIKLISTSTYLDVQEGLINGSIDLGILNTLSYLKLIDEDVIIPIASRVISSSKSYKCYIIVKKDSDIDGYDKLKGKRFAMGDLDSTSATLMAQYLLTQGGISVDKDLEQVLNFTKQDSILFAILNGSVDAGGVASFIFDDYDREVTSLLTVMDSSETFPLGPFIVNKELSLEVRNKLTDILLKLHITDIGQKSLKKSGIEQFVPFNSSEYNFISKFYSSFYGGEK